MQDTLGQVWTVYVTSTVAKLQAKHSGSSSTRPDTSTAQVPPDYCDQPPTPRPESEMDAADFKADIVSSLRGENVQILYSSPMTLVRTNNNLSVYFSLQRGTRQEYPMSLLLFTFAIELLALAIRQDINIKRTEQGG